MREQILKLREQGLSFRQIKKEVGCSSSTVAYYCSPGQKEKAKARQKRNKYRKGLQRRVCKFKSKDTKRSLQVRSIDFQRNRNLSGHHIKGRIYDFNLDDVLKKIGDNPICYLTGDNINLENTREYHFDHIIPTSKGGKGVLSNLGIATKEANRAKGDLMLKDFIKLCKKVLENNGYKVDKQSR